MFLFTFSDFLFYERSLFLRADFANLVFGDFSLMVILRCEKCGPGYFGQPDIVGKVLSSFLLLRLGSESALCSYVT